MKIGILTFHRATNYGAVLQCYGLYETLRALGHEVEVIDYRPEYIEKYRKAFPLFDIKRQKGLFEKAKMSLLSLLGMNSRKEAAHRFDIFLKTEFEMSSVVLKPNQMPQKYDIIFFGSDQIWSPQICLGFDEIYWGQFPHDKTRLVTYAASIGGHNHLNGEEWEKVGKYLMAFENISVREIQLQKDLNAYLGIKSQLVVDPTILLKEKSFDRIVEKPKDMPDNYVLVFSVAPTENLMGFAEKVAKESGSEIVTLTAEKTPWIFRRGKERNVNPTVGEFLGWFKYAKYIVTVSFHGTVFSVLFRRDFYSLANYMQDRAEQFLNSVGLNNRLIPSDSDSINNLQLSSIDYCGVEKRLESIRESSREYIKQILLK